MNRQRKILFVDVAMGKLMHSDHPGSPAKFMERAWNNDVVVLERIGGSSKAIVKCLRGCWNMC